VPATQLDRAPDFGSYMDHFELARLKAKEWLLIASQGKDPCKKYLKSY
tara:strand:+ start:317 stop:460 length:144 start_codon:yes stop_codon:yes gene_type:complete